MARRDRRRPLGRSARRLDALGGPDARYADLREAIRREGHGGIRFEVHYNGQFPADEQHALRLDGVPGVELASASRTADHRALAAGRGGPRTVVPCGGGRREIVTYAGDSRMSGESMAYLSVCAIYRDEEHYLREWIEFHRLVGVERFYLYNNLSVDDHREVLAPYVEAGIVTVTDWTDEPPQMSAYEHCLETRKEESRWIAVHRSRRVPLLADQDDR